MTGSADGLPAGLALADHSTLQLFPVFARGRDDRCVVVNLSNQRAIRTNKAGVRAIELLREARTLGEVKQIIARDYGCDAATVDVAPLIEALWRAGFVRALDGRTVGRSPGRRAPVVGLYLALFVLNPLLSFLLRYVPLKLAVWVAHRVLTRRNRQLERRIGANLGAAPALALMERERHEIAAENRRNVRKLFVDRALLGALPPRRLHRWLQRAARVSGLEHLARAIAGRRGTVLCGFHMGSYSLIPFILGARGVPVTVLAGFGEAGQAAIAGWMAELEQRGFPYPVRVVSGRWALRSLVKALADGATVLLYCDRALGQPESAAESRAAVRVPFLGTTLYVPSGIGWLRERTGAVVLPTILLWEGDQRHHLIIEPEVGVDGAGDPSQRIAAVTAAVYRVLDGYVRRYPAQWLKWKDFHHMTCG